MTDGGSTSAPRPGREGEARPTTDWIWLDGELLPADVPHLTVADRGFQLGDGVFETLRARRGVPIELAEHLDRLQDSARAMAINLPDRSVLATGIRRLLAAVGLGGDGEGEPSRGAGDGRGTGDGRGPGDGRSPGDAAIRITVTRGALPQRGLLPAGWDSVAATVAIQAWPYAPPPAWALERGLSVIASLAHRDPSSPLAGVKSTSRAELVHAKLEADRAGADDAIFLTIDGRLSEATSSNLFLIRDGSLLTPSLSAAILSGTTRTWLLEEGRAGRLSTEAGSIRAVQECDLWPADLLGADEAFLSSSVAGILPLTRYRDRPVGIGAPGPLTLALRALRERWIDETARASLPQRATSSGEELA